MDTEQWLEEAEAQQCRDVQREGYLEAQSQGGEYEEGCTEDIPDQRCRTMIRDQINPYMTFLEKISNPLILPEH